MAANLGDRDVDVNLTPLLDLVLQLIMFFMITVNFVAREQFGKEVQLPKAQIGTPLDQVPDSADKNVFLNVDKDGKLSLFDLYVVVAKEIAQSYASAEQLATEHQQIDDDGDGVGHEPQNAYLPEEQGGTPPGKKSNRPPPRDGLFADRILLSLGK